MAEKPEGVSLQLVSIAKLILAAEEISVIQTLVDEKIALHKTHVSHMIMEETRQEAMRERQKLLNAANGVLSIQAKGVELTQPEKNSITNHARIVTNCNTQSVRDLLTHAELRRVDEAIACASQPLPTADATPPTSKARKRKGPSDFLDTDLDTLARGPAQRD